MKNIAEIYRGAGYTLATAGLLAVSACGIIPGEPDKRQQAAAVRQAAIVLDRFQADPSSFEAMEEGRLTFISETAQRTGSIVIFFEGQGAVNKLGKTLKPADVYKVEITEALQTASGTFGTEYNAITSADNGLWYSYVSFPEDGLLDGTQIATFGAGANNVSNGEAKCLNEQAVMEMTNVLNGNLVGVTDTCRHMFAQPF